MKILLLVLLTTPLFAEDPRAKLAANAGGSQSPGVVFDAWWQMCIFAEDKATLKAVSETIVRQAFACGVNIKLEARLVSNVGGDPKQVAEQARKACNVEDSPIGAKRASALVIPKKTGLGKLMCSGEKPGYRAAGGVNADRKGCGEYSQQVPGQIADTMAAAGAFGGSAPKDKAAVSIVDGIDAKGQTNMGDIAIEAQKWALGVSEMNWLIGRSAGNGVGDEAEGAPGSDLAEDAIWKPKGCARLQSQAMHGNKPKKPFAVNRADEILETQKMVPMDLATLKPLYPRGGVKAAGAQGGGGAGGQAGGTGGGAAGSDGAPGVAGVGGGSSTVRSLTKGDSPDDNLTTGAKGAAAVGERHSETARTPVEGNRDGGTARSGASAYEGNNSAQAGTGHKQTEQGSVGSGGGENAPSPAGAVGSAAPADATVVRPSGRRR